MNSLAFRVLDHHVIHGRADNVAVVDGERPLTYAKLLELSAALAGGLRHLGVEPGSEVDVEALDGRDHVVAVLACLRLGAVPSPGGAVVLGGDPAVVRTPEGEWAWDTVRRSGVSDPAAAPGDDPEGYEQRLRERHDQLITTLLAGDTIA